MDLQASAPERGSVIAVRPFLVHSTPLLDVTLRFDDGRTEQHRLGRESVDEGLVAGDRVTVERVMSMVVGVRRVSGA